MSNIGNKIRAGFFATPPRQGEFIRSLLNFESETAILDPTAGEGHVLKQLAQGEEERSFLVKTYAVELDKARAAQATEVLDTVVQSPIESMVISHNSFGLIYLNPPYDRTMLGYGDEKTERKEYIELVRNTKYLAPNGVLVFVIPSYRYADEKMARYLATHFEDIAITKFTEEDYDDYRQCIFIGKKKDSTRKTTNDRLLSFLMQMNDEDFVAEKVTPIDQLIDVASWTIPATNADVPIFYSRIENKSEFIDAIQSNKGFQAFKERTRPKQLEVGGDPLINVAQGLMALLLSSGAVNGLIGRGDSLHAVQGMEIVSTVVTEEESEHAIITKRRTKRDVSVKVITPSGKVIKYV